MSPDLESAGERPDPATLTRDRRDPQTSRTVATGRTLEHGNGRRDHRRVVLRTVRIRRIGSSADELEEVARSSSASMNGTDANHGNTADTSHTIAEGASSSVTEPTTKRGSPLGRRSSHHDPTTANPEADRTIPAASLAPSRTAKDRRGPSLRHQSAGEPVPGMSATLVPG